MNIKKAFIGTSVVLSLLLTASPAFAHVVVTPNEVGVAQRVDFAVGVPTEEDVPTVGLRLVIPEGLQSVTPYVKPGWEIEIKKTGEGEEAKVTEIIWTGGSIPAGQRDEFVFRGMTPAEETDLQWKAYQTYEGGKVVAWDADPKTVEEHESSHQTDGHNESEDAPNPFSVTKVINDLAASPAPNNANGNTVSTAVQSASTGPLLTGGVVASVIMSAAALLLQARKRR